MTLKAYLELTTTTRAEFAARIGVSAEAIRRYTECGRVPTPKVMAEILRETDGAVTANDFFREAA